MSESTCSSQDDHGTDRSGFMGKMRFRHLMAIVVVLAIVSGILIAHFAVVGSTNNNLHAVGAADAHLRSGGLASNATTQLSTHDSLPLAPNAVFTSVNGQQMSIAGLRGKPIMLWLVVNSCSSCFASVPDVAEHFSQLTAGGLKIVTLGLYGSVPSGKPGLSQIASFGRASISNNGMDMSIPRSNWLWGVASKDLSLAYDPSGTPDTYVLIGQGGHIRYRNSVPVSTMPQLLAAVRKLSYQ